MQLPQLTVCLKIFIFLQVYLSLFKTYISPPDANTLRIMASMEASEPNINAALDVLQYHHEKVDTARVS